MIGRGKVDRFAETINASQRLVLGHCVPGREKPLFTLFQMLGRVGHQDGHGHVLAHAQDSQGVGLPAGALMELAVGKPPLSRDNRRFAGVYPRASSQERLRSQRGIIARFTHFTPKMI